MISKEDLVRMYWEEEKCCRVIAEELNTTRDAIIYQFKKLGIKRRTKSEARKLFYKQGFITVTSRRGEEAINWRGGRNITKEGYVLLTLKPEDDFFKPMCQKVTKGSFAILEHRLVMAKHLGRCLSPLEKVHHLNSDKQDNRIDNLELISPTNHSLRTFFCHNCPLKQQNRILKQEIIELRSRDNLC